MADLLTSLGQAGTAPGSRGLAHRASAAHYSSLSGASCFGTALNGQMDALGSADPLAALTALVQNGTSISTIVSTLAGQLADAVQQRLPAAQLGSGASRTQLVDSIQAALSPPSNAPPGTTAAQGVAALARRLQTWIESVAREADQQAGQQGDTSGQILDATSAKELPAQQDPQAKSALNGIDALALARSLLASVAATLSTSGATASSRALPISVAPIGSASPTAVSSPGHAVAASIAETVRLQSSFATQADGVAPDATANSVPVAPNAAPQAPAGATATQATVSTGSLNPPDLLARMLVRAAGVDTQVNGTASDDSQNATVAATLRPPDSGGTSLPPVMNADRLAALFAEAIGGVSESASGDGSSLGGGTTSRDDSSNVALGTTPNAPAKSAAATTTDAPAFAVSTASPSSANPTISQQPATTPTGASVDPNAIVEQVVKGMAMRSNADGSSEMRLRLEPEQLGTVTLKLTVNGSSVSATAIAQNADVRSALMAHQTQLSRSLSESGLKLTSFTVDLSGGDAGNDRNHDRTSGFGRRYTVHEVAGVGDQPDSTESPSSGPPLLPGSTVALLDYLA